MANHKSALKKHRRDQIRRMINKMNRTKMKNKIKKLKRSVESGNLEEARQLYPGVMSVIDKTVIKGTIHKNTGSRYKARLSNLINKTAAAS